MRIRQPCRPSCASLLLLAAFATPALAGVNTWTPVGPDGGAVRAVAFHPSLPGVIFAAAGYSIYRSADSGQSWTVIRNGVTNGPTRIIVDPTNGSRVMTSGGSTIYRSDDGGLSFSAALGPTSNQTIATLAIAPDGSAVYVATYPGNLFRSVNFGATWTERSNGLPAGDFVRDLVVDPSNANTLYAITSATGVYHSTDAGANWSRLLNAPSLPMFKIAVDPGDSNQLLLAAYGGLFSSPDAGATWVRDPAGNFFFWVGYHPSPTSRVGAAVAIQDFGPTLRRASRADPWIAGASLKMQTEDAAFDPLSTDVVNSTLLLATPEGPLFTQNGGASYTARSQGIRAADVYGLAAATYDPLGTIYAAFASGPMGLHRRDPSGWVPVDNVELRDEVTFGFQPMALAVDPHNAQTVFVASGTSLMRSIDGGQTWEGPHPAFGAGVLPRVAAFAPSSSQILYLGADGQGAYYSNDVGVTWIARGTGLPTSIGAVAVDSQDPNIAYAGDRLGGQGATMLFKTTNGGVSWAPASAGVSVEAIEAIAVTPSANGPLYAGGVGNGEGLFKSTDGAASWARVGAPIGDAPGTSIAIDPVVTTNVVMAMNSIANGAARSVDAGATWDELHFPAQPGNFPYVIRNVVLDPLRPHVIIGSALTYGLVEFEVAPDLEVTLPSVSAALPLDGSGSAMLRVTNRGPFAASAVRLTLTPPMGTTAPLPAQGNCTQAGAALECNLGAIRANQSVDTTVTLLAGSAPAAGTLMASVTAHERDPALANNSVSAAVVTRRIADLGVTLAASAATVDRGTALDLTATATNNGPNAATDASVVITLGNGLGYRSASATQGPCAESAGVVTCALGLLSSASQAVVTIGVAPTSIGTLAPSAAISDNLLDPVAPNNSAATTVTSRPVTDAEVQITDVADPAISGQSLQYAATMSNAGPDELPASTVTISITGATVAAATTDRGSCSVNGATATCTLTAVPSGASAAIQVQGTAGVAGTASATATVAFQGTDTSAANNTATQSTTINDPPRSGGGGGSGVIEILALLAALLGSVVRRRRVAVAS